MPRYCQVCGKEIEGNPKKLNCEECLKEKTKLFYEYSYIRFEMWKFVKDAPPAVVAELYKEMIETEGEIWVRDVLGEDLVCEVQRICSQYL